MINITEKEIYSWEVIDNSTLIKNCDKTVFAYSQTGIPKELKDFFGYFDETGKDIILIYQNVEYTANLKIINGRARLTWKKDLKAKFALYDPDVQKIALKFTKHNNNIILDILATTYINDDADTDIVDIVDLIKEGLKKEIITKIYARSKALRETAIKLHGTSCAICGFNFEEKYGNLGKDFIEIHHIKPLYMNNEETIINPEKDLIPVCSNCHRMLHRHRNKQILPSELKNIIDNEDKNDV